MTSPSPAASSVTDTFLVTGVAGFIGFHVAKALLARGARVLGVDNLNDYYTPTLKRLRLTELASEQGFAFVEADICDYEALRNIPDVDTVTAIVHLAAQAGVRYALDNPFAYASSNLTGHLSVLELARHLKSKPRLIYASSSSVYGANTKTPFSEDDPVVSPVSLYAATKSSNELVSESYARLYGIRQIGLRFFTVYGPWGRPDMACWLFTENILSGKPIRVFNNGDLSRDFTYIDDIVGGVLSVTLEPMRFKTETPHRVYNIGNDAPVRLLDFIRALENVTGREAVLAMEPMQPGDVCTTHADISAIAADYSFHPKTPLQEGLENFVDWYKQIRTKL